MCGYTQCAGDCSTVHCTGGTSGTGGLTGSGGAGGTSGTGGVTGSGGIGGAGGATWSPDAEVDGRVAGSLDARAADGALAMDAAVVGCEYPLPLRCGDRLNHSTLVQGRADVWKMYGCTQRLMSGREAIYVIQSSTARQVSVRLSNLTADLDIFLLQGCSFMSCDGLYGSNATFIAEAGQAKYLVVDGYSGAAGSYTLEVDCTDGVDGGGPDAPPADAPADTSTVAGCDSAVATQALSELGIVAAGDARTLSATLPAALAADANWGLKATVCQQAGYDLDALAGGKDHWVQPQTSLAVTPLAVVLKSGEDSQYVLLSCVKKWQPNPSPSVRVPIVGVSLTPSKPRRIPHSETLPPWLAVPTCAAAAGAVWPCLEQVC
jgi:hypothetical protein